MRQAAGYDFAISRRIPPEVRIFVCPSSKTEQLCRSSPAIGRPQGWRWRAPAYGGYGLDPARSPVCWLCKRSVEAERGRGAFGQLST
jgi:hypothetical protein